MSCILCQQTLRGELGSQEERGKTLPSRVGKELEQELELSKKLAVLGWIFRKGLITEDEYNRTRIHIMGEYGVISFMTA